MASENQYYSAKVLLKSYADALSVLDEIGAQQNELNKLRFYRNNLKVLSEQGKVTINSGLLQKNQDFDKSRVSYLSKFSQQHFKTDLNSVLSANTAQDLLKILKKADQ